MLDINKIVESATPEVVLDARGRPITVGCTVGSFVGGTSKYWVEKVVKEVVRQRKVGRQRPHDSFRCEGSGAWCRAYNWVVVEP